MNGLMGKILRVNLTESKITEEDIPAIVDEFLTSIA